MVLCWADVLKILKIPAPALFAERLFCLEQHWSRCFLQEKFKTAFPWHCQATFQCLEVAFSGALCGLPCLPFGPSLYLPTLALLSPLIHQHPIGYNSVGSCVHRGIKRMKTGINACIMFTSKISYHFSMCS